MTPGACLRLLPALAGLGALALTPLRPWLEAGMRTHMLVQFPLLMLAGALMASAMPASASRALARCNALGLAGLALLAAVLALAMVPRALDLALADARVEAVKFAALLAAGAVVRASWRAAGTVVQAFFVGSVLPMTAAAGSLYIDAPVRLCNAYLLGEQQRLGTELIAVAAACGTAWLVFALYRCSDRGAARAPASTAKNSYPAWHSQAIRLPRAHNNPRWRQSPPGPEEMNLLQHGEKKFQSASVLASSSGLGWKGVAAELRAHPVCELPPFRSEHLELTVAILGNPRAVVSRRGGGARQETRVTPGTVWICPPGVDEDDIAITGALPQILHIYLPGTDAMERATDGAFGGSPHIRYLAGLRDELINQLSLAMLREAMRPSAGGALFVEALGIALMARLVHSYSETGAGARLFKPARTRPLMAAERLDRVIEFMRANIESDVSLQAIAAVACLSTFHFSRVFAKMTGMAPHHYLASLRMEHAKKMLATSDVPLADIASAIRFSSQANFSRAFRRAVGMTPLDYRIEKWAGSFSCGARPSAAWRKPEGVVALNA